MTMPKSTEFIARREFLLHKEDNAMIVNFRPMQVADKELFKSFIRALPRKDNFYLMVNVHNDEAMDRWMEKIESGETIGVIATKGGDMIGYGNVKINDLPWTRHVGEIRMSVSAAHRGHGIGRILAGKIFSIARSRGLQKLWVRMASSQEAAQVVFQNLGFHTEALLSGFVKNENGLIEDLVIMSHDSGELWSF